MRWQELGKLRGCRSFPQKERLARFNQSGSRCANTPLLCRELQRPAIESEFHAFGDVYCRSAIGLAQKAILLESFDVTANSHHRDAQFVWKSLRLDRLVFSGSVQNQPPPFISKRTQLPPLSSM